MEEQLIYEAKNGNHEALARLLYLNYEIVYRYMLKFTMNRQAAEDLVQEAMVRAIEKLETYDVAKARFSTWLITVARNIYLDNIRKRNRENKYLEEVLLPEEHEPAGEYDDSWDRVLEALAELPGESRFPLLMKHYYGYSLEEIARMMGIPLGTVKSRIHNALKAVRRELE